MTLSRIQTGPEILVDTTTTRNEFPKITALADGGYVITWTSSKNGFEDIFARRYDSTGTPVGNATVVNTTTAVSQFDPEITTLTDGGYIITWVSWLQDDGSSYGIYAQRYDATGVAVGGETRINSTTANDQTQPAITALRDGGYVIAWTDNSGQGGSGVGVYA